MSNWKHKYKQDIIIAILIVVSPFIVYFHLLFSNKSSVLTLFDYKFEHWFANNEVFIWMLLSNFLPLLLLLMMFFTTKPAWKYFLMPLLLLYLLGICHTLDYITNYNNYFISVKGISLIIFFSTLILLIDGLIFRFYRDKIISMKLMFLLLNKIKLDQEEVYHKLRSIRKEKTKISIKHYLKKIYYLKTILRNALKNISNNTLSTNKNRKEKIDLVIVFIVIILTALWFVDSQIPTGILELEFFGVKVTSSGFKDVNIFIWFVSRKLIVMIFLSLWFITCQHWWKFAILSPLLLFSYQFWEAFQNVQHVDAFGNLKVFPLVFLTLIFVIIVSRFVKYEINLMKFYESISNEMDQIIEELQNEKILESKKVYKNIKNQIRGSDNEEILPRLIEIKDNLLRNLES